jgi:uncharacterized protein (DUF362 family)
LKKEKVALVRYKEPIESVKEAVRLGEGLKGLPPRAKVFIKPNIVVWPWAGRFPKWGVITTSRIVEDMVRLLKDSGAREIIIGEGLVTWRPGDDQAPEQAFASLGYYEMERRYGVKVLNLHKRPFQKVNLGKVSLLFNHDLLESDFLVNLPVLKTHCQTVVSLGMKNLKGTLDISSRKKCHNPQTGVNLDEYVSLLGNKLPPSLTLIDGIYSLERGPGFGGRAYRSDLLIASANLVAADFVGALLLGHDPSKVPHLAMAAQYQNLPPDSSWIDVVGESLGLARRYHPWEYPYAEDGTLPLSFIKKEIQGISYPKYDQSLCTYCFLLDGFIQVAIRDAWKGKPFDQIEILTGKIRRPSPGYQKTVLLGQCMCRFNHDHPNIQVEIPIKGCPPTLKNIIHGLCQAGIEVKGGLLDGLEKGTGPSTSRYEGHPEFSENFFQLSSGN